MPSPFLLPKHDRRKTRSGGQARTHRHLVPFSIQAFRNHLICKPVRQLGTLGLWWPPPVVTCRPRHSC